MGSHLVVVIRCGCSGLLYNRRGRCRKAFVQHQVHHAEWFPLWCSRIWDDNAPICSYKQIQRASEWERSKVKFNYCWSFMGYLFSTSVLLETFSLETCETTFQWGLRQVKAKCGHTGYLYTVTVFSLRCPRPVRAKLDSDQLKLCSAAGLSWNQ